MCTNLRDVWTESVGVISQNVYCKNVPAGGAIIGQCQKVPFLPPGNVCAKCHGNRIMVNVY